MDEVPGRHLRRILAAGNFDEIFAAVASLIQEEGAEQSLRWALLWSAAAESEVRTAGLHVLAAIAQVRDDVFDVALREAAKVPSGDPDEELRWSAAHLLASLPNLPSRLRPSVVQELLRFEDDSDGDVRWQVVFALPELAGQEPTPDHPAVQALLRRLKDHDPGVRDWAAFGIGLTGVDTPEVRRGLRQLLLHPEEDAAGEAAVALGQLQDRSILPELLRQLALKDVGNLWVEAAAALAAPEALPLLERLATGGWGRHDPRAHWLDDALLACGNVTYAGPGQHQEVPLSKEK